MVLLMVQKSGKPVEVGSLSLYHYLQGFIHPRWCRSSSMNSIMAYQHTLTTMHVLPATFDFNRGSLCSMLIAKIDLHVACCMSAFIRGSRYMTGARKETIALVSLSLFMQSVQVQRRPPLKEP